MQKVAPQGDDERSARESGVTGARRRGCCWPSEREQLAQRPLRAAAISVVRRPPLFYPFDFSLIWLLRPRNSPPDLRLTLPGCVSVENIRKRRRRRSLRFPQQVSAKPWALFSLLTTPGRHAHVYKDLLYFPFSLRRVFFKRKPHSL